MVVVNVTPRVLILGARPRPAGLSSISSDGDIDIVSALAGRVQSRMPPASPRRSFAGATGLTEWIRAHGVRAVIDATHPFAATMSWNAAAAAAASHIPLLALRRTAWPLVRATDGRSDVPGGRGTDAARTGHRYFLTIGRRASRLRGSGGRLVPVRSIDPPDEPTRTDGSCCSIGPYSLDTGSP